jgi:predicted lipoprotein with Yx(FWY)xxD motif
MFRTRATATAFASFAAVGVLLLSACGANSESNAPAASSSPAGAIDMNFASGTAQQNNAAAKTGDWAAGAAPAAATSTPVIRKWVQLTAAKVGALNPVVVNGAGFTLYRFDKDSANPSVSNCTGACATTWPPYLVARDGRVFLDGVDKSAVGAIQRDGAFQLTIGGRPVYLFNKDTKPGDANGQGVGGTWFGVTPDGQKAGQSAGGTGTGSPTSSPASSVTVFQGANFADPAQGVGGPGCQNVTFSGSLRVSGFVKIWDGDNCTGNSKIVEADVPDLSAIGFPSVKSIRFFN